MNAFNKIILGFMLSVSISVVEAQTKKLMFDNTQPTKRIYNDNEIILPKYLQYEKTGASGNMLESTLANNMLQIRWQTKAETNTSHFKLQCSIDGQRFEPIETIAAKGFSKKNNSYSTTVTFNNLNNDPLYYRLKSVFVNGKEVFTSILVVDMASTTQESINQSSTVVLVI